MAIARELSKYDLNIVLLEKLPELAAATTKANSGICHAGYDPEPGSLKAILNVRGNALYRELQEDLDLPIKWTGAFIVATSAEECAHLESLTIRAKQNRVPLEMWPSDKLREVEPHITPSATCALFAPTGGIMWPFGVALAFAENAVQNGVTICADTAVSGIQVENTHSIVETNRGAIRTTYIINAAGLYADSISRMAGDDSFNITPRKGEYILFDTSASSFVNTPIFPCPTAFSKGILVSPTTHGNVFIGPNANDISDKEDMATTLDGFSEIIAGARKLFPQIPLHAAITNFAGLRATADGSGDFIIKQSFIPRLIHAGGIQSPGLTSAPAIAEMVAKLLGECGCVLTPKTNFVAKIPKKIVFKDLSDVQKAELIRINPAYGHIICRCETITEGEIVDSIKGPIGARTVDGVKRRVRAGMGRCQGGFCGPRVVQILARELNLPITAIKKDAPHSELFFDKIRSGEVQQ